MVTLTCWVQVNTRYVNSMFRSLLLCLCDVFRVLINSLECWFGSVTGSEAKLTWSEAGWGPSWAGSSQPWSPSVVWTLSPGSPAEPGGSLDCATRNKAGISHTIQLCTQAMRQGAKQSSVTQFNSALKPCDKEQSNHLSHNSTLHSSSATWNNEDISNAIQAMRQGTMQVSVTWFNSALKLCGKQQCRYLSHDSTLHSSCATSNNACICHMIQLLSLIHIWRCRRWP